MARLSLPSEFSTLLVKGPYPTAAPLDLALECHSIILTARDSLRSLLQDRDWRLTGKISALAERVHILYPPSAAHMALILSTLQVIDTEAPFPDTYPKHYPHLLKPPGPALIILHDISTYFTDAHSSSTSAAYLSLVTRAISLAARLGARLAVFDAQVNHLRMPVYPDSHLERMQEIAPLLENYIEHIIDFDEERANVEAE
ncbi:hypothetical protein D9757_000200 [Collybiopsis confluens]|uniref:Uncharacterized protein n=1 Tax=Collybiopsis confluens TaxID=2823264 RepID=A0A8H5I2K3_9AGAR|nr:hypothetical protein D9757_000200 [Collybiopsis confluens]